VRIEQLSWDRSPFGPTTSHFLPGERPYALAGPIFCPGRSLVTTTLTIHEVLYKVKSFLQFFAGHFHHYGWADVTLRRPALSF
jgi:hypothetical protein